ncbi:hypothetical protein [Enterococcus ureasiticus]|uniref:WxL domain-containing protein n=1 Tax=Enterococcus ureasiticus TaxID=903984 RepID=A0A1E5GHB2_9ENTE|nr:hypothetical protein [Enterococcus ureasiticus]OEG12116.1 hypothetical protein BCR21_07720 [Enterococcus ureasiticus]
MKLIQSEKMKKRLIVGAVLTLLAVAGAWQWKTTNLSAAPKEETKTEKETKTKEKKEQAVQSNDEQATATRTAQPMPLVSNEEGLKAEPKTFRINQNAAFPTAGSSKTELEKLVSGLEIPQPASGINWKYVTESGEGVATPSSAEVGFQMIYVEITEMYSLTSIVVPIPVSVTNADTTMMLANTVALQTDTFNTQIILYQSETIGKSNDELKELIMTKSNARAWDVVTGEAVSTTVSQTNTQAGTAAAYTATFRVEANGIQGTTLKNVIVYGANLKSPYYFTTEVNTTLDMGTNASNLFTSYRTTTNTAASSSTYEWVTSEGEPTNPVNTFKPSEQGFQWGYIKMTEKLNPQISGIIRIPIMVTYINVSVVVNGKAGLSYTGSSLNASEVKGKTVDQIMSLLMSKYDLKVWDLKTGENLDFQATTPNINQGFRGNGDVNLKITYGTETLNYTIRALVVPDDVFGVNGREGWEDLPIGAPNGLLVNPINKSRIGFAERGMPAYGSIHGFFIQDENQKGYVWSSGTNGAGNGRVSDIPGVGSTPLYGTTWNRNFGLGYKTISDIDARFSFRKGDSLKQVLVDSKNKVLYVYDINLAVNLNFSISLNMYNLDTTTRKFSMLESVDTDYLTDNVPIYALGNNSGFYMEPQANRRLTIKLKDNQGNWLSDYTKYIAGDNKNIGTNGNFNYFGNNFSGTGTEARNLKQGATIISGVDSAYQLGAPWKPIPMDGALKTGYQVFVGEEMPYMKLKATPETWNIYQDDSSTSFETDYTLSQIPEPTSYGTVYVTYPNNQKETIGFESNANKTTTGHVSIPRSTLPAVMNDVSASIKTYQTELVAINEAPGTMKGLPSEDYSVNINVYNLGVTLIAQSIKKDTPWTKSAASLVKDPVILPGHTATFEFVDGTPDTSTVGVQMIKVRMTDSDEPTQTKIIEVPLNVTAAAPPTTGLTIAANDFTVRKSTLEGLSTDEIKALILKESKAIGWDNGTGLTEGVSVLVNETTLTAESDSSGSYTAKIRAEKGSDNASKTINIKVNAGLDAAAVLQTVTLGTGADYWTAARLKASVKDVKISDTAVTDYSVTLLEAPVTKRISTTANPTVPMLVKVTDNQNPSNTLEITTTVRVTWGNAIAFGGSNTIVTSPNAQSSFVLSLHEDSDGKPRLVSGYGNLPSANEGTPLSSSTGAAPYYQVTRYDLSGQATGVTNAKEVTSGPNAVGDVTFQGLGTNTPAQLVDTFGTNGQLTVNYGDVLRLYTKDGQRALYTNNAGPTQLLGGVPDDETVFVVVTKNGFEPLYFNQLDAKDISISSELTSSEAGYNDSYTSISSYFSIPNGVSGTNYTRVAAAGFKTYPKLNLAVGEEETGSVYVTEPTSALSNQYLKYAYDVTFVGTGPELQIVGPLAPLSFGTQKIKSYTQEIKRTNSGWGFTVLDSRLVKNGWVIQAKMENPFETGSGENIKELKGAALQLKQAGKTLSLNDDFQTIYQKDAPSASNFVSWSADEGFSLQVPSGAIDKDATYSSRVDMILTNAPTE